MRRITCSKCDAEKMYYEFGRWNNIRDEWCRDCKSLNSKEWKVHSDARTRVFKKYGLYPNQVKALKDRMNGCWICGLKEADAARLVIDHCHDTGKFRGILCDRCNVGAYGDDIEMIEKRLAYLKAELPDLPDPELEDDHESFLDHPLYRKWVDRRNNGRVDEKEWETFEGFLHWATLNGYPENGSSLCLINPELQYSRSNCFIGTHKQAKGLGNSKYFIEAWGERKTIGQWSSDPRCACSKGVLYDRLRKGVFSSTEEAIATEPNQQVFLDAWGEVKNIAEWSRDERCLVPKSTLEYRIRKGMDPEVAMTQKQLRMEDLTKKKYGVNLVKVAKEVGIGRSTLQYRMSKGMTLEEAIEAGPARRGRKL